MPASARCAARGLYGGVEFVADRATRAPFPAEKNFTSRLVSGMKDRGVIIGGGVPGANFGQGGDHIQITPPFIVSEAEIDILVDALDDTIGAIA